LQHRVGLADTGGGAEEDLQLAARPPGFLLSDADEQLIGIGPSIRHGESSVLPEAARAVGPRNARPPRGASPGSQRARSGRGSREASPATSSRCETSGGETSRASEQASGRPTPFPR